MKKEDFLRTQTELNKRIESIHRVIESFEMSIESLDKDSSNLIKQLKDLEDLHYGVK